MSHQIPSDRNGDSAARGASAPDEAPEEASADAATAARLFDVRRIIGGLFVVYGVLVTGAGILDGSGAKKKAQGVDINLWSGIAMLVVGALFLLWMKLSPNAAPADADAPDASKGRDA